MVIRINTINRLVLLMEIQCSLCGRNWITFVFIPWSYIYYPLHNRRSGLPIRNLFLVYKQLIRPMTMHVPNGRPLRAVPSLTCRWYRPVRLLVTSKFTRIQMLSFSPSILEYWEFRVQVSGCGEIPWSTLVPAEGRQKSLESLVKGEWKGADLCWRPWERRPNRRNELCAALFFIHPVFWFSCYAVSSKV